MPPLIMGRDTPLRACLDRIEGHDDGYATAQGLREMYATDDEARRVIDVAKGLEGLRRQDGIHAAAVVITKEPLTEYLPVQRKPESGQDPAEAPIVTQYEMHGVEELGLLKMDFLGPAQPVGHRARPRPGRAATEGPRPDIDAVALDDEATFAMLRRGGLDRRVPARGRRHALAHAVAGPDVLRRRGRPGGAVPPRAHGGQHAPATTPTARTAASR